MFTSKNTLFSIYIILSLAYYPLAVFFSHYCYRHFKHHFMGNNQLMPQNGPAGGGNAQQAPPNNPAYQRFA
jgi:hypothetical protein